MNKVRYKFYLVYLSKTKCYRVDEALNLLNEDTNKAKEYFKNMRYYYSRGLGTEEIKKNLEDIKEPVKVYIKVDRQVINNSLLIESVCKASFCVWNLNKFRKRY